MSVLCKFYKILGYIGIYQSNKNPLVSIEVFLQMVYAKGHSSLSSPLNSDDLEFELGEIMVFLMHLSLK